MNKDVPNATILLCTCDSYEDLWYPFFTLLHKYWPDLPYKVLLNTETKVYAYDGIIIDSLSGREKTVSQSYGERIIEHIKQIDTKYTILMLDDFFVRRRVDSKGIKSIIEMMEMNHNIAVTYLTPGFNVGISSYNGSSKFDVLDKYSMYKLNMQAAVWKTERLLNYWSPDDNPWMWEIFANYTTFDSKDVFLQIHSFDDSPIYYGFNPEGMGVFRGKWVKDDVVPLFRENDITIDYSQRGFYEKESEKNYYKNKAKLLKYMIRRIGINYTFKIIVFYIKKYLCKAFNIKMHYINHPAQLQAKYVIKKGG